MKVFKFGGASVKNADAVKNVSSILSLFEGEKLTVIVSAMGKTTNALESLHEQWFNGQNYQENLNSIILFHQAISNELITHKKKPHRVQLFQLFKVKNIMLFSALILAR